MAEKPKTNDQTDKIHKGQDLAADTAPGDTS